MQSVAPTSVYTSRLRKECWSRPDVGFPTYESFFGTLDSNTFDDATRAEVIIKGLESKASVEPAIWRTHQITRIELVWSDASKRRGAILFASSGAQLHCRDALLGYFGSGPAYTKQIFKALGADDLFEEVSVRVGHRDYYHFVVSREPTVEIEGVRVVLPNLEPFKQWRWWEFAETE